MSKIGDKIKEIRIKNGLSQEQLAKELGYTSKSTITKLETGVNNISVDKLELFAQKFNVVIDELFDDFAKNEGLTIIDKYKTERVELTVLCLIENGDKLLLQNRVKNDWRGYTLPGGHVELGESFVDACIREVKEETNLDIKNPKLVGVKQFPGEAGRYIVFLFKTNEFEGELQSSNEGKMEWIEYKDISKIKTVDDFEELLKVMNSNELSEFQYVVKDDIWEVVLK
jgi:8-oxo-dGTP diphosphatase